MSRPPNVWTVVVAGGSGNRFGSLKQFESIGDERVIDRARRIAESVSTGVVVVVPRDHVDREPGVVGGATRADSVRAGLAAVPDDAEIICVHDAARPFATPDLYRRVIAAVTGGAAGAVPGIPVADTIKVVDGDGRVVATPDRSTLVAVQTPQAFRAAALRAAHASGGDATDDAGLLEAAGETVVVVPGEAENRKITLPDDLRWVRDRVAAGLGEEVPG